MVTELIIDQINPLIFVLTSSENITYSFFVNFSIQSQSAGIAGIMFCKKPQLRAMDCQTRTIVGLTTSTPKGTYAYQTQQHLKQIRIKERQSHERCLRLKVRTLKMIKIRIYAAIEIGPKLLANSPGESLCHLPSTTPHGQFSEFPHSV